MYGTFGTSAMRLVHHSEINKDILELTSNTEPCQAKFVLEKTEVARPVINLNCMCNRRERHALWQLSGTTPMDVEVNLGRRGQCGTLLHKGHTAQSTALRWPR